MNEPTLTRLDLSLLGPFAVRLDGEPVTGFASDKVRALLAYLAVEGRRPHRRDALAGLLWPDYPDSDALASLRQAVHKLRQALGEGAQPEQANLPPYLVVTPQTVQLDPATYRLDVDEFTTLVEACRTHRHRKIEYCSTCHARFRRAAQLYRGEFLAGFILEDSQPFDEWLVLKQEGLRRQALEVFIALAAYHAARFERAQALRYIYRQLELEPWREEAHRLAMRLLALDGQRVAALAQYEMCRKVLREELGLEPEARTTALYEDIKAGDREIMPAPGPDRRAAHTSEGTPYLPEQLTPFIGREEELARINELLDSPDYRLVTLVGLGGVGKTRLALQAAYEQVGAFDDGVRYVPLASVDRHELIASSIAQAAGLRFGPAEQPEAQLLEYLRDKEILLVLDNFEHLLGGSSQLAKEHRLEGGTDLLVSILKNAPKTTMLVTSRERLGLQAEHLFDVSGLPLPEGVQRPKSPNLDFGRWTLDLMTYDAVRLFVERAQRVQSEFALSPDNAQGVLDICRLVEGLPLGIVLAAAWVRHFPTARIAKSIRDNLDFLRSSSRDASAQHGSLRAVFNHSWNLLPKGEQQVLRKLSVFRGGWDEDAAEKIAGASVYSLSSLVDKSLLRRDASGRFSMHEMVRQYAAEQLQAMPGEQDETQAGHAVYFLDFAERAEREIWGPDADAWLTALDREHDNFRAALRWAGSLRSQGSGIGDRGSGLPAFKAPIPTGGSMSRIMAPMLRSACAVFLLGLAVVLGVFVDWGPEMRAAGASGPPGKPFAGPLARRSVADLRSLPPAPQTDGGSMLFRSTRHGASRATGQITNPGPRDFGPRTSGFGLLDPSGYGAPAVITGFNGIDINDSAGSSQSCFCLPPDGDMAAGPNHVIVGVNQAFRVFDKSGSPLTPSISYDAFFNGCGPSGLISSDPVTAYDPVADRFTVGILRFDGVTDDSYVSLAVSTSGDPTTSWNRYCFEQLQNGLPALYDFPHISVGQTALFTTGNIFPPGFEQNTSARVNAYPKAQMYAGVMTVTQVYTDVTVNSDLTPADTIRPALFNMGLPSATSYFVNSSSTPGSSRVTLWRWTDPFGANLFEQAGGLDVAPYLQAVSMLQPAPGSPMPPVPFIDDRTLGGIWANGTLYATHAIGCNSGSGVTDCVQWYQLGNLNGAPTLIQQGIISGTNESRAYPNLAVDRYGNVELAYAFSSPNDFIGIRHTGRLASDPPGQMGPEGVIKAGEMAEVGIDAARYGDYSGSVLDPDGVTLWHFEEYTQDIPDPFQLGSWGTWTSASRFPITPFVGHVTWQGPPPQPDAKQSLPISLTLRLQSGGPDYEFANLLTDASGFFTVSVGTFPSGTYSYRVKGPKYLASASSVTLAGAPAAAEMGLMKVGDCNNDNVVNAVDFAILKNSFGKSVGQAGYDDRAEFTGDGVVNAVDFTLLRDNFGQDGAPPISP